MPPEAGFGAEADKEWAACRRPISGWPELKPGREYNNSFGIQTKNKKPKAEIITSTFGIQYSTLLR